MSIICINLMSINSYMANLIFQIFITFLAVLIFLQQHVTLVFYLIKASKNQFFIDIDALIFYLPIQIIK